MNGAFSPLKGFLTKIDYDNVLSHMRLADGSLWPIPIILDVTEDFAKSISVGRSIALCDQEGVILAKMLISDRWEHGKIIFVTNEYLKHVQEHQGNLGIQYHGLTTHFGTYTAGKRKKVQNL